MPAALVDEDQGTTLPDGTRLRAGQEDSGQLLSQRAFDWHQVSAAEAADGVRRGRYDFALTIPTGFSAALGSTARYQPRQARLRMVTNDANSYLSTTIADQVTSKVRDAIAQKVGTEAATRFLTGIGDIRSSLVRAAQGAHQLHDGLVQAASGAGRLASGATTLKAGAGRLAGGLGALAGATASLPARTRQLADGARRVAAGDAQVAAAGRTVAGVSRTVRADYAAQRSRLQQLMQQQGLTAALQSQLLGVYDALGTTVRGADTKIQSTAGRLDQLASGAGQVATGTQQLADAVPALVSGIAQARSGADRLSTGAGELATGAGTLQTGLQRLERGSATLANGLDDGVRQIPAVDAATRNRLAATIGDPVDVASASQASAGSYGAGLAPFFMSLAAWIGGYVLFLLVRPLSRRAMAANQTPLRIALGGWMAPALIGLLQVTVLLVVVLVGIHIVPANIVATLLFLLLTSATFVAIVHSLNAWLGTAGQFLGLVLMVLQLVTAGGTFPWQTIPAPLYVLHHVLPMSYAVDGLRQLMYGGLDALVLRDVGVLVLWLALALLATARAARRQRVWRVSTVTPELAL